MKMAKECALCGRKFSFGEDRFDIANSDFSYCKSHLDVWKRINDAILENPDCDKQQLIESARTSFDNRSTTFDTALNVLIQNVKAAVTPTEREAYLAQKAKIDEEKQISELVSNMLLTTGSLFDGYKVEKYIDIVSTEIVFKSNWGQAISAAMQSLYDIGGTEMYESTALIAKARDYAMEKFKRTAAQKGANAILGVDLESSVGVDLVRVSVFGTAVIVIKEQ